MNNNYLYFRMDDANQHGYPYPKMVSGNPAECLSWNNKGWGIYRTVNPFLPGSTSHKTEFVAGVNYWIAEFDKPPKDAQLNAIIKSPLHPSFIVESKNGYHVYWKASNARINYYKSIEKGIERFFKSVGVRSDPQVKNINRFLRMPGYYHWKDIKDPYMVNYKFKSSYIYTEAQMQNAFNVHEDEEPPAVYTKGNLDIIDMCHSLGLVREGFRAYCPFITSNSPHISQTNHGHLSMALYPKNNSFHCFSCSYHGTSEALKIMVERFRLWGGKKSRLCVIK